MKQIDDVMTQEIEKLQVEDPVFRTEHGELCFQSIRHLWTRVWDVFQHLAFELPSVQEKDLQDAAKSMLPQGGPGVSADLRLRQEQLILQMIKSFELGAKSAAMIMATPLT